MDEQQFERMMKVLEDLNREVRDLRRDQGKRDRKYADGGIINAAAKRARAGR